MKDIAYNILDKKPILWRIKTDIHVVFMLMICAQMPFTVLSIFIM